jgi:hypothetical protein
MDMDKTSELKAIPITLENAKSAFSSDVKIRAKVNAGFENYQ